MILFIRLWCALVCMLEGKYFLKRQQQFRSTVNNCGPIFQSDPNKHLFSASMSFLPYDPSLLHPRNLLIIKADGTSVLTYLVIIHVTVDLHAAALGY